MEIRLYGGKNRIREINKEAIAIIEIRRDGCLAQGSIIREGEEMSCESILKIGPTVFADME